MAAMVAPSQPYLSQHQAFQPQLEGAGLFQRADLDRDGQLSREEYSRAVQGQQAERAIQAAWVRDDEEEVMRRQARLAGAQYDQAMGLGAYGAAGAGGYASGCMAGAAQGAVGMTGVGGYGAAGFNGAGAGGFAGYGGAGDAAGYGGAMGPGGPSGAGGAAGYGGAGYGGAMGAGGPGGAGCGPGYFANGQPMVGVQGMPGGYNGAGFAAGSGGGPDGMFPDLPPYDPSAPLGSPSNPVIRQDRKIVALPKPKYPGGKRFFGTVAKDNVTFAPVELCATPEHESALCPQPEVAQKSWYNTYLYVPEEHSHVERQFMERFVQGPDGEWLDVVKAKRMANYFEEKRRIDEMEKAEQMRIKAAVNAGGGLADMLGDIGMDMLHKFGLPYMKRRHGHNGEAITANGGLQTQTPYHDPYSGEALIAYRGQLMPRQELLARHDIHESITTELQREIQGADFDNLRLPWPFGQPYANKKMSQHVYDWFGRDNPYIPSDRSYEVKELPSTWVDAQSYGQWRAYGQEGDIESLPADALVRARYFDDYPYRM